VASNRHGGGVTEGGNPRHHCLQAFDGKPLGYWRFGSHQLGCSSDWRNAGFISSECRFLIIPSRQCYCDSLAISTIDDRTAIAVSTLRVAIENSKAVALEELSGSSGELAHGYRNHLEYATDSAVVSDVRLSDVRLY
jgi:hypothetical protein